MLGLVGRLIREERGAVAPIVALSMVGLIAAGGIAFDYARLAAMDTELQSAADQAALAAVTQLDRAEGAQDRASDAVTAEDATDRLAANLTRFANDGEGAGVEVSLTFCKSFDDSVADTAAACDSEDVDDASARFVVVTTTLRTANYALTPIVAAFSGTSSAQAVAGVEASICNVAPLLVCVADDDFPTEDDIGRGIVMKTAGGDAWVPGNYGLLDFGNGNTAVIDALLGFGLNGCQSTDDNQTEPGNKNVTDAVNTRMDVYIGNKGVDCDSSSTKKGTGKGCPTESARKDMVLNVTSKFERTSNPAKPTEAEVIAAGFAPTCPAKPVLSNSVQFVKSSAPTRGLTRDECHYAGDCEGGNFGDKAWNRDAYFLANYGWNAATWQTNTGLGADATRFEVYTWELDNPSARLGVVRHLAIGDEPKITGPTANRRYEWTVTGQCNYGSPVFGSTNYETQKDRRILPIVAANCSELKGKGTAFEDYQLLRVFDVLLTEPSVSRTYPGPTDDKEIYGEVIGPSTTAEGGSGFQYYARSKPYLIR